jgi:hypothetical protein
MRKYENVDVIAALGAVMEINTEHYKSHFQYDIEMFQKGAATPDGDLNRLLWLSRPNGTECFRERDAHVKEIHSHNAWCYYADTKDTILAYAVEITVMEGGKVKGNLYELDYQKHVKQLKQAAQLPIEVTLFQANSTQQRITFDEYKNASNMALQDKYGAIQRLRFEVADESNIRQAMKQARSERQKYTPAVFKLRNSRRKPSIRAQLTEGKAAAVPKQAAAHIKTKKAEVSL